MGSNKSRLLLLFCQLKVLFMISMITEEKPQKLILVNLFINIFLAQKLSNTVMTLLDKNLKDRK